MVQYQIQIGLLVQPLPKPFSKLKTLKHKSKTGKSAEHKLQTSRPIQRQSPKTKQEEKPIKMHWLRYLAKKNRSLFSFFFLLNDGWEEGESYQVSIFKVDLRNNQISIKKKKIWTHTVESNSGLLCFGPTHTTLVWEGDKILNGSNKWRWQWWIWCSTCFVKSIPDKDLNQLMCRSSLC